MNKVGEKIGIAFGVGALVGTIAGVIVTKKSQTFFYAKTPKVLHDIKKNFSIKQTVVGSWIQSDREVIDRQGIETEVYVGGLTCETPVGFKQFEFLADAKTGGLIDIYPL